MLKEHVSGDAETRAKSFNKEYKTGSLINVYLIVKSEAIVEDGRVMVEFEGVGGYFYLDPDVLLRAKKSPD